MSKNAGSDITSLADLLYGTQPKAQAVASTLLGTTRPTLETALGGLVDSQAAASPTWPFVVRRFKKFLENIMLTDAQVTDGMTKFKGVVACLNAAYYGTNSETDNAFYIGSWAKKTRIRPPRDVDLYFVLPVEVYHRFETYSGNKQSALLQEVKAKLLASYPTSNIKGDGPVVLAGFWTFNVEVVPAFPLTEDRAYWVPSTKNGGSYLKTKPLHEVDAIEAADQRNNSNVRRLVRMLKCWQANCSVPLRSFYLELLATEFIDQWAYKSMSYFYYDWMCRDFFAWLISKANSYVLAPGTFEIMWIGDSWKSQAETASMRAHKACEYEKTNKEGEAGDEWQKIFGADVPKWV
ncbi:SMODS domain-containing nucleotidyltransferase [Achromobacter aloeverae]|nr:nucleotidyltransferase [Achromobacter aloeverae]